MLRKIQELRILKAIVGLSKDPETTDNVFFMADAMLEMLTSAEIKEHTETILKYPGFAELYQEHYSPPLYNVQELSTHSEDTLAHAYGVFMKKHGYQSDWYPKREASDALSYMRNRLYQTHDVIHTMTGFDGSPFGEIAVQAFYLGQMPEQPLPCAIMSSGFLRALRSTPWERDRLMHMLHEGYEMGRKARPVLFRTWEKDWDADISELRNALGMSSYQNFAPREHYLVSVPKSSATSAGR